MHAKCQRRLVGQVGDPFSDRGVGAVSGHDRAHRRRHDGGQTMSHSTTSPRIGYRGQRFQQTGTVLNGQTGRCDELKDG